MNTMNAAVACSVLWMGMMPMLVHAESGEMPIPDSIRRIDISLDGHASVEFVESEENFSITEVQSVDMVDITVKQDGDRLVVQQHGRTSDWFHDTSYRCKLHLPRGRDIHISVGNAAFSGIIAGRTISVSAGMLTTDNLTLRASDSVSLTGGNATLSMQIRESRKVRVVFGNVSGRIMVPMQADVNGVPMWSALRIDRTSN